MSLKHPRVQWIKPSAYGLHTIPYLPDLPVRTKIIMYMDSYEFKFMILSLKGTGLFLLIIA